MWSHERQARIFSRLGREGKVVTNDLAQEFDVSRETVRRDLLEMEEAGLLSRVHGGAVPANGPQPEPEFAARQEHFAPQKAAIGTLACALIPMGATCFVDAGTTTTAFARALAARGNVRVITNSFEIARIMAGAPDSDVLMLGGVPHADVPATYGELTLAEIDRFRADLAVISPVAVDRRRGISSYHLHEAEVARKMIHNAHESLVLAHAAKLDSDSRVTICALDDLDHLVTDAGAARFDLPRGETHYAPLGPGVLAEVS